MRNKKIILISGGTASFGNIFIQTSLKDLDNKDIYKSMSRSRTTLR